MYTNLVAGLFIRHKCYDPEKPNNHTTVQFLFNDLTIKCIIPLSTITGRQHFKKKVPRDIIISVDIYIHMYIHTPNTHIFVKKHHVFPQSNTNIRTTSPGAYIHTIVSCCVCFFYSEKNLNVDTYRPTFQQQSSVQYLNEKKKKNIKFKTSDAYFMFVAWYQSRPCCGCHFTCFLSRF